MARLEKVDGSEVHLSGLDLLDGTPVLDIKPYIPDYDAPKVSAEGNVIGKKTNFIPQLHYFPLDCDLNEISVPEWIQSKEKDLIVSFTPRALMDIKKFDHKGN